MKMFSSISAWYSYDVDSVLFLTERIRINLCNLFQVVKNATGNCHETMTRKSWYVGDLIGHRAQVRLVDFSSVGWGHINFDDMKGDITCTNYDEHIANIVEN